MLPRLLTFAAAVFAAIAASHATAAASQPGLTWAIATSVGLIAAARPAVGLMLVAALAPLGGAIGALWGLRTSATEPLLLSVLAGWLVRRTLGREDWDFPAVSLAGLFALVVLTSLLSQCVLAHQLVAPDSVSFSRALLDALTSGGTPRGPFRPELTAAWRLAGGVGLFVMTVEIGRRGAAVADGSLRLLTVGAAAVAVLNISRFVEIVLRRGGDLLQTAMEFHRVVRISSTIADVNAAGAMFALALPAAAAQCVIPGRRLVGGVTLTALIAGLWLTGSRAGMVGGAVGLAAYLTFWACRHWTPRQAVLAVGLLCVTLAGLVLWYPRGAAHTATTDAWQIRKYLAIAGIEMARESPAFGVGIGRFRAESARFAPQELQQYYRAENAHNQVLQLLGELGLPGAALFLALLACSLLPGWRQLPHPLTESFRAPAALGLLGWLLSSLLMHPLLVAEASAAFWLVLGVARSGAVSASHERRGRRWGVIAATASAVGLLAAVPVRTIAARKALNLDGVGVGLTAWHRDDGESVRYRTAKTVAAIYVDGRPGRLRVPLRIAGTVAPTTDVDVWLDGRPAGRLTLASDRWTDLSLQLPTPGGRGPRYRRLDFRWTPATDASRLDIGRETYIHDGDHLSDR